MGLDKKFKFIPCDEDVQIYKAKNYTRFDKKDAHFYTEKCRHRAKYNRRNSIKQNKE